MSNCIPRYAGKKEHLPRREQELLRIIKRGESREKTVAAAEEVQASRLRVIETKRAMIPPRAGYEVELAKLTAESQRWNSMPIDEIIANYEKCLAKLRSQTERFPLPNKRVRTLNPYPRRRLIFMLQYL